MSPLTSHRPLGPRVHALRVGEVSLRASIEEACARINDVEDAIGALVPEPGRRERLLAEADALGRRFPDAGSRPPLYGVLVGVKDVFHAAGFPTRAGSAVPTDALPGSPASSVQALLDAGALILGKTVTAEFAGSAANGTRNPHDLDHTPGGSSSGSAAAVAAGYCELALGTQTVGSVIRPAAFCGVVGFKPSYGRIPTDGIVEYSASFDTVGMFTQDIAGMALVAAVLCHGWRSALPAATLTLGVPDGPYLEQASAEGRAAFERQVAALEGSGYRVVRVPMFADHDQIVERHYDLATAEFVRAHADRYARYADLYRPESRALIERGKGVSPSAYAAARRSPDRMRRRITQAMETAGIDLWICPAALGPAPQGITATGSPFMNLIWTHAGLPALNIPAGKATSGLPLGLQLVGRAQADEELLAWSADIAAVVING